MMSSSEDEMSSGTTSSSSRHIFYKDRPEWSDVEPIPSDEGPTTPGVVAIDYSDTFADVYDYVRGVIKSGELSARVLSLTGDAIMLNAANYTVWQLRRDVLEALGVPKLLVDDEKEVGGLDPQFEKEFSFCARLIEDNQKNYQVWHHQKALVAWAIGYDEVSKTMTINSSSSNRVIFNRELNLTKHILGLDAKNYHAWQHRQWILGLFRDFTGEQEYINTLLTDDVRNNSAWNQRHFVLVNLGDFSRENLMTELEDTWTFIMTALRNESSWSYLRGLMKLAEGASKVDLQKEVIGRIKTLLLKEREVGGGGVSTTSVPMLGFYIETMDDLFGGDGDSFADDDSEVYNEIICLLDKLIEAIDPIRSSYWEYVKRKFELSHFDTKTKDTKNATVVMPD